MTRRWVERLAALIVVALLTAPLYAVAVFWPWLLPYLAVALAALVAGLWVGYLVGRDRADSELHELTHEWRMLFLELGLDHGKELEEQYDAGFVAAMNAKEPTL